MISSLQLNLLVIRSAEPARLAEFYSLLGLQFIYHQHGTKGTWHYSANVGELVFEIYPLLAAQGQVDTSLRLGFQILNLEQLMEELKRNNVKVVVPAKAGEWGYRAVVEDVEGRRVELVEQ